MKNFFENIKKREKIIIFLIFSFAVYCALVIGQAWDEKAHLIHGKITLDYILSFGKINNETLYRENYSTLYWSTLYFLTKIAPLKYEIEATHLINLFFSLSTVYGIRKLAGEIFNKDIGKIVFVLFFFYPIFFGHMGINSKDTILAFSHVWISYLIFRYLKNQNLKDRVGKYLLGIALLAAIATGIQLVFLGSLIPMILLVLLDIFFIKKFTSKHFLLKKFLFDLLKCFAIFYLFLILFWIDSYSNIFLLPFKFLTSTFSETYWTGWPYNLVNGIYYNSNNVPKYYLITNFIFKSPEYILILYFLFFVYFLKNKLFFEKNFKFFNYKIAFIISVLVFPNLVLFFIPYPVYDGVRLFIWTLPYLCIVPGLALYYLYKNIESKFSKLTTVLISVMMIYFLYNFFQVTPYQYTYLNFLNGEKAERYKRFENDYWGVSLEELIKKSSLSKNEPYNVGTCGTSTELVKKISKKYGYKNFKFVNEKESDLIIMTNRATKKDGRLTNCFDKYEGKNVSEVRRGDLTLSSIRKIR